MFFVWSLVRLYSEGVMAVCSNITRYHGGVILQRVWFPQSATNHRSSGVALKNSYDLSWLVVLTILKNMSQWEGLSHILWKTKNVPNHQPDIISYWYIHVCKWVYCKKTWRDGLSSYLELYSFAWRRNIAIPVARASSRLECADVVIFFSSFLKYQG